MKSGVGGLLAGIALLLASEVTGLDAAKSLYMVVKPGEFPNYPEGKNDPAHIRREGAFFYAKAAVEMSREQGLSLARLWNEEVQ